MFRKIVPYRSLFGPSSVFIIGCLLFPSYLLGPFCSIASSAGNRSSISNRSASEGIQFDVPALVSARVIVTQPHRSGEGHRTIEIVIPVTSEVSADYRGQLREFRFDVFWNRSVYPICDYGPRTQTVSQIDGTVAVDETSEKNATFGLTLNGGYQDIVKGTGTAELGTRGKTSLRYQEIPQHEILVASGTINRGTGAFFRFHPSRTETLEGGRDLVVVFEVPHRWRGGLLQVDCRAQGERKLIAGWTEPFESSRAFIVPVFLEGDDQARRAATEFVRSEHRLRSQWDRYQSDQGNSRHDFLGTVTTSLVMTGSRSRVAELPENWVHFLIQSSDAYLEKYRPRMPVELESAAELFVAARTELVRLSR